MTTAQIIILALIAVFALLSMASMLTRSRDDNEGMLKAVCAALTVAKEECRVIDIRFEKDGSVNIFVGAGDEDDEPVQDGD